MEKTFDVIGVEDLIMDFALQIARIPKTDGMALIEDSCWAGGGNASSAIVALARLGARCAMVGTTGNDAYGAFCRADMEKNGVDVSHVKQVEGETTLCVCLAERETQGRSFLGRAGVAGEMTAEDVDEQLIANARVVHLSCSRCTGQEAAVKFAKKHGVEVSLDAALLTPATKELADQSDILSCRNSSMRGFLATMRIIRRIAENWWGRERRSLSSLLEKRAVPGRTGQRHFAWRLSRRDTPSWIQPERGMSITAASCMHICTATGENRGITMWRTAPVLPARYLTSTARHWGAGRAFRIFPWWILS